MRNLANRYLANGMIILVILQMILFIVDKTMGTSLFSYGMIGFVCQAICLATYWWVWKKVQATSPKNMPILYMAASGARLFFAAFVLLIYMFLHKNTPTLLSFSIVFSLYYIITLVYDTIYFVSAEKKKKR